IHDLDRAIVVLGANAISAGLLQQVNLMKRLQAELNGPGIQTLLSLWSDIDTYQDDSLYRKLFLNKAVLALDDQFALDSLNVELKFAGSNLTITDHTAALLAAFRISAAELALIRIDAKLDDPAAQLNLTTVSVLHRYAALANALHIRVNELIKL